jgi:hypothetical protein
LRAGLPLSYSGKNGAAAPHRGLEVEVGRLVELLLLLLGGAAGGFGQTPAGVYPLVYFGRVLLADSSKLELRLVGTLSPAARSVAADPRGWIWGRLEPRHLAALDPDSGEMVARVRLPHKPETLLITPAGKAYVTHSSRTKKGFTMSEVDTGSEAFLGELDGIAGTATDLAQTEGLVYLAAEGASREDSQYSYFYRIDSATDQIREVMRLADAGSYWKLAADGGRLYLGYLPTRDDARFGRVEAREARSFALLAGWDGASGPLRARYAAGGRVLLFCEKPEGETELLVLDPLLRSVSRRHALQGPVARVLGVRGATLTYLDYAFEAGNSKVNVCFYDLEEGRELRRIDIREFLLAGAEKGGRLRR